jgi:hypothetical protein
VECLVFKGLAGGQAYSIELLKYIFKLLAFFIGNSSAMIHVPCVASKQGTPTITKPTTQDEKTNERNSILHHAKRAGIYRQGGICRNAIHSNQRENGRRVFYAAQVEKARHTGYPTFPRERGNLCRDCLRRKGWASPFS